MALRLLWTLLFAALTAGWAPAAQPSPSPSPASDTDPCGGAHTDVLAAMDRPTVGFSACAVKPHDVLAEFGYANETTDAGQRNPLYPQGFIRYGVGRNLEADIIGPTGHYDAGVGLKYEFFNNARWNEAVDVLYTGPNGAPAFTAGKGTTTVNFDAGTSFSDRWSGGVTVGYMMGPLSSWLPSVAVVNQFSRTTQVYFELYGATRIRPDGGSRFAYDGGVQHLVSDNVEIDVEAGHTVTDVSRSHYLGVGFGVRL